MDGKTVNRRADRAPAMEKGEIMPLSWKHNPGQLLRAACSRKKAATSALLLAVLHSPSCFFPLGAFGHSPLFHPSCRTFLVRSVLYMPVGATVESIKCGCGQQRRRISPHERPAQGVRLGRAGLRPGELGRRYSSLRHDSQFMHGDLLFPFPPSRSSSPARRSVLNEHFALSTNF